MPLTGLFLIPLPASGPSTARNIKDHIALTSQASRLYRRPRDTPYTLTHHMFVNTSSLLPGQSGTREYTQILSLGHTTDFAYVGTKTINSPTVQIAVSSNSVENLRSMLTTKLTPQWSSRQTHIISEGFSLQINGQFGTLEIRIGDLKTQATANKSSIFVGVLIEANLITPEDVTSNGIQNDQGDENTDKKTPDPDEQTYLRLMVKKLLQGTNISLPEVESTDGTNGFMAFSNTSKHVQQDESERTLEEAHCGSRQKQKPVMDVSELYMEILRHARS